MVVSRKARPGDDVAGFCTTSSPSYSGSVRSSSVCGSGNALLVKPGLVGVEVDEADSRPAAGDARDRVRASSGMRPAAARRRARRRRASSARLRKVLSTPKKRSASGASLLRMILLSASPASPSVRNCTLALCSASNWRSTSSPMAKESCVATVSVAGCGAASGEGAAAPPGSLPAPRRQAAESAGYGVGSCLPPETKTALPNR